MSWGTQGTCGHTALSSGLPSLLTSFSAVSSIMTLSLTTWGPHTGGGPAHSPSLCLLQMGQVVSVQMLTLTFPEDPGTPKHDVEQIFPA